MHDKLDPIAESGLQFFGKITASISHEINNVLAIINENAGLLEDISLMSERGAEIDPERLKRLSQAVTKQVRRANTIIKNMNRFAHSTDEPLKSVDLIDTLELMIVLSTRLASMRSITLELKVQENPVKIRTAPFLLMNFIWLCLDFAMDAAGDDKIVELYTKKTETGAHFQFRRLERLATAPLDKFPSELEKNLLNILGADLVIDAENNEFIIKLTER